MQESRKDTHRGQYSSLKAKRQNPGQRLQTANVLHESDLFFMKLLCFMIEYDPAERLSRTEANNMVQKLRDEIKTIRCVYEDEISDCKWQFEEREKENFEITEQARLYKEFTS